MVTNVPTAQTSQKKNSWWKILLALPYLGLCFPQLYARSTPALWGFPFFYWYQFAWVILASIIMGVVYRKLEIKEEGGSGRGVTHAPRRLS